MQTLRLLAIILPVAMTAASCGGMLEQETKSLDVPSVSLRLTFDRSGCSLRNFVVSNYGTTPKTPSFTLAILDANQTTVNVFYGHCQPVFPGGRAICIASSSGSGGPVGGIGCPGYASFKVNLSGG